MRCVIVPLNQYDDDDDDADDDERYHIILYDQCSSK